MHVIRTVLLGLVEAVCAITTAWAVARLGSDLLIDRVWPHHNVTPLVVITLTLALRAGAVWLAQITGHKAATATIADLRSQVVAASAASGPRGRSSGSASTATLATTGLENLRPYLTGYVPQLALSATVTPLALIAIAYWDLTSALVACIAIPLIPIFMILIGKMTEGSSAKSLATMRALWSETLDLVEGLPTLRALGRARGSEKIVADLGARHKKSAMTTLAFAFLSSFALELIATLGVALIAVSVGLRLVAGSVDLFAAIAVLVLAAEVYLPLRMVGQQFHASTDGLAALDAAFEIIQGPVLTHGSLSAPDLRTHAIEIRGLSVQGRDRFAPYALNATIAPGRITALRGSSGDGKSTTIAVLLGLLAPSEGTVSFIPESRYLHPTQGSDAVSTSPVNLAQIEPSTLWQNITWLPQRPVVGPGTLEEIVSDALPEGVGKDSPEGRTLIHNAAARTGLLDHVIAQHGWKHRIGRGGVGLSVGQRQRLALTTALLRPQALVILDEPTSHLDGASEAMIVDVIRELQASGSTVLLTAHRESLLTVADCIIDVHSHSATEVAA